MRSIAFLILRLTVGGLIAGHGAQKLFGWFGGQGIKGTAGWMESIRLKPGTVWARLAGGSEFLGGVMTALGFLNPLGPIAAAGAMLMAWTKVHLGKPIWTTKGGAELPLTNLAALASVTLAGPGRFSLDGLFGIRIARAVAVMAMIATAIGVYVGGRRELAAGTSDITESGEQVEGDPTSDSEDAAAVKRAGRETEREDRERETTGWEREDRERETTGWERADRSGVAVASMGIRPTPVEGEVSESLRSDMAEGGTASTEADAGGTSIGEAGTSLFGAELDETTRVGESGADAGTAMGTGSELGSETPEDQL
jgi:putative oxidoreductase